MGKSKKSPAKAPKEEIKPAALPANLPATAEGLIPIVAAQADKVKALKASKSPEVSQAVSLLLALKAHLKVVQDEASKEANERKQFRVGFEDLMLRKFFYVPAFEIYGGVGGLYDYGPPGCAIKANFLDLWRKHFVLNEHMLEIDTTCLTPEIVLKTSGHVDKFTDFMCKDLKTGDCHRADKILEDHIDALIEVGVSQDKKQELLAVRTSADAYDRDELEEILVKYGVKAPGTNNDLSAPFPFNLMFQTMIGPTGKLVGYFRPETAQGIFVNFRRLLEFNAGKMPFAAAQIGLAFRNEISPRSGLLRVREFPMAEIEHFCNPNNKAHPRFKNVAQVEMNLLSRAGQTGEDKSEAVTIGEAVAKGTVNNETLGYFMARTQMFFHACGVIPDRLRFRQHKSTEMAHYAQDCWDAEILMSYGWIECVGHADRSAYDLKVHSAKSKVDLSAQETLAQPMIVQDVKRNINHGVLGKRFRKQAKEVKEYLEGLSVDQAMEMEAGLNSKEWPFTTCTGDTLAISRDMVSFVRCETKISVNKYIPSVIEPSFGIGRCIYGILEHAYIKKMKKGVETTTLKLSPLIAPIKCGVYPVVSGPQVDGIISDLQKGFVEFGLVSKVDSSGASIGRRYARADEVGTPCGITIDADSLTVKTVTLRDRDSTTQVRVPTSEVCLVVRKLCTAQMTWAQARQAFPHFASPADEEEKSEEKSA